MHPPRFPYRGKASALRASKGVHYKTSTKTQKKEPGPKVIGTWIKTKIYRD